MEAKSDARQVRQRELVRARSVANPNRTRLTAPPVEPQPLTPRAA
jgi:hypothetical protein